MNTNNSLQLDTQRMNVTEYLTQTYPHLSDEYVVEQRDCGFGVWNMWGTFTFFEEAKRIVALRPAQTHVRRLLHRRLETAYYPVCVFDTHSDDLYTPVRWRGRWSDYERSVIFDLLQARDPKLYPLDVYQKWRLKRSPTGTYSAWRNLFQRYAARTFDELVIALTNHYERSTS